MPRGPGLSTVHPEYDGYFNDDHLDLGAGPHKPNPLRAKPAPQRGRYQLDGNVVRQSTAAAFYNGVVVTLGRRRPPLQPPAHDDAVELQSVHVRYIGSMGRG